MIAISGRHFSLGGGGRRATVGLHAIALMVAALFAEREAEALTFDVEYTTGVMMTPKAAGIMGGVSAATSTWSGIFKDPVTVKVLVIMDSEAIDIDLGTSPFTFGAALNKFEEHSYSSVKTALLADSKSVTDAAATILMQPGPYLEALTHDTSKSVADLGVGVSSPEMRIGTLALGTTGAKAEAKWNSILKVSRANSKALGLAVTDDGMHDIRLVLNDESMPVYDVSRGDGIMAGMFDFQAIATHEIGHGMGFVSGVDDIDYAGIGGLPVPLPAPDNPLDLSDDAIFSVLDLYRTHGATRPPAIDPPQPSSGFVLDWRFGPPPGMVPKPFFSLDSSAILPPGSVPFATGAENGDSDQSSHWADGPFAAIMKPDLPPMMIVDIGMPDITALDAIGWDTVPEPASILQLALGLSFTGSRRRHRLR